MDCLTLESVDAFDVGRVDRRQKPQTGDQMPGRYGFALVGGNAPQAGCLVELGGFQIGVKLIAATQVKPICHMVQISQDLGLGDIAMGPVPFLQQVFVKGIAVDIAFGIRQRAGIAVPVPSAAYIRRIVDGAHVQALLVTQFMHRIKPAKTGPDNNGVKIGAFGFCCFHFRSHVFPSTRISLTIGTGLALTEARIWAGLISENCLKMAGTLSRGPPTALIGLCTSLRSWRSRRRLQVLDLPGTGIHAAYRPPPKASHSRPPLLPDRTRGAHRPAGFPRCPH